MIIGAVALLLAVPVFASDGAIAAWRRDTSGTLTSGIDQYGNLVVPTATVDSVTFESLTLDGDLDLDGSADFNMPTTNDVISIVQTNVVGAGSLPFIDINDDRTGDTANSAAEATVVITSEGTHAVSVAKGITAVQALTATTISAATSISGAINGTNITVGNIPEAALTNAAATLGDDIGGNIPETAMTNGLATTIGLAASALQPNTIVVSGATSAVDTAAITVSNGLGAASTVVGIWSAATNGAASTANLISLVATTGTLLSETNSATIVIVTDATGYAALTATVSAATTNYVAFVQNNGARKSSAAMILDGP
jgi:hypothetical protein